MKHKINAFPGLTSLSAKMTTSPHGKCSNPTLLTHVCLCHEKYFTAVPYFDSSRACTTNVTPKFANISGCIEKKSNSKGIHWNLKKSMMDHVKQGTMRFCRCHFATFLKITLFPSQRNQTNLKTHNVWHFVLEKIQFGWRNHNFFQRINCRLVRPWEVPFWPHFHTVF